MATHDYNLANQSGASFRSDLNGALQAIVTNNSSDTEPSTTFAHMLWLDTANDILKIRNAENSGWIDWISQTGTILAPDGDATNPGITFASDTNTGFHGGGNEIDVTCNGVTRATFATTEINMNPLLNSGQDFVVGASGESEMFFVDGADARVGIANGSPETLVHIRGNEPYILIQNETQEDTDGGRETRIFFRGEQSGGEWSYLGVIEASHDGTGDDQRGKITLSTNDGNDDNSPSETAILDSDGRFTIGGSPAESDAKSLNVVSTAGAVIALARDESTITGGNDIGAIRFYNNDGGTHQMCAEIVAEADGTFANDDKPTSFVFNTASDGEGTASTKMVLDSEARLIVGHDDNVQNQSLQVFDGPGLCLGLFKHQNNDDGAEMTFNSSRHPTFGAHHGDDAVEDDDYLGRIFFRGSDGNSFERGAEICCRVDGTPGDGDMPGRIEFLTTPDGSATPTARVVIHNGGVMSAANGIELGSALDATAANTLDDYEEGTFTPTFRGSGTAGDYTPGTATGFYTKVGRKVYITVSLLNITTDSDGSPGTGDLQVTGLPFAANNDTGASSNIGQVFLDDFNFSNNAGTLCSIVAPGESLVTIREIVDNGNDTTMSVTDKISNGADLVVNCTYIT